MASTRHVVLATSRGGRNSQNKNDGGFNRRRASWRGSRSLLRAMQARAQRGEVSFVQKLHELAQTFNPAENECASRETEWLEALTQLERAPSGATAASDDAEAEVGIEVGIERAGATALHGAWRQVFSTLVPSRRGTKTTLGRLSFGKLHPPELEVIVADVIQIVGPSVTDDGRTDAYDTAIEFTTLDSERSPIRGRVINKARYRPDVEMPERQHVTFLGATLAPVNSHDTEPFVSLLRPHNPGMDRHTGAFQATFGSGIDVAFIDVLHVDEHIRVTKGSRGAIVVVQRLEELPGWASTQAS